MLLGGVVPGLVRRWVERLYGPRAEHMGHRFTQIAGRRQDPAGDGIYTGHIHARLTKIPRQHHRRVEHPQLLGQFFGQGPVEGSQHDPCRWIALVQFARSVQQHNGFSGTRTAGESVGTAGV
jgi:hypothetical protein